MTSTPSRTTALLLNFAHALDHMFLLIFATAVGAIAVDFGFADWESLMPYGVGAFMLFGLGSLPAGRLGDLWGRRRMMLVFFFGMGASSLLVALTRDAWQLAAALTLLGAFSSIYHPVGIPMLVRGAERPGLTIGINGLAGNLGVALAAVTTGLLVKYAGWRAAFVVPALLAFACGMAFARVAPRERAPPAHAPRAASAPTRRHAGARLRRHDDRRDFVEPAVQLHDQRQRPAAARALDRHRRRSGAARAAARARVRRRVVRAGCGRSAHRPLSAQVPLSRHRRAAGAAVRARRGGDRLDAVRAADRVHGRGVRRDSVHRRDDRALRRRSHALARQRHAPGGVLRRQLRGRLAAGTGGEGRRDSAPCCC